MLFAQIIAFILVMVIFEAYQPAKPLLSAGESILGCLGVAVWLAAGSHLAVRWLLRRLEKPGRVQNPVRAAQRLLGGLQAAPVAAMALMVTSLDLKAHLLSIPLLAGWQTLAGLAAVAIYFLLLVLVWWAVHPLERLVFQHPLGTWAYMWGQARFVAPVVFPWLAVSALQDVIGHLWSGGTWLQGDLGDLFFLAVFLLLMGIFFPVLVRFWWGCRPWPRDRVRHIAEEVLRLSGVRVAAILSWPVLQGRLLTAGILGVVPRFRYLLLTPAITEVLTPLELAGVVAHEAGHVRHRHLLLYLMFFLCFFIGVYALTGPVVVLFNAGLLWLADSSWGRGLISAAGGSGPLFSLVLALPLVAMLIVYLRYVMGFFMRHFERQADLFALQFMGEAAPLAGALEKLALLTGDTRELPSWHHFSVAQRVEALGRAQADPGFIPAHAARLRQAFAVFFCGLALVVALGIVTTQTGLGERLQRTLIKRALQEELLRQPHNLRVYLNLGVLLFEEGQEAQGIAYMRRALRLAPHHPEVLNGLAWFLATAKEQGLRRPREALRLALAAVTLSPRPHIWDTLAEAYFINGYPEKALAAEKAALALDPRRNREHYQEQLRRFEQAVEKKARPRNP